MQTTGQTWQPLMTTAANHLSKPPRGQGDQTLPLPPSNPELAFLLFAFSLVYQPQQTANTEDLVTNTCKHCGRISPAPCHGARLHTHHHPTARCRATSRPHAVLGTLTHPNAMRPHPTATYHSTHTTSCAQSCNPNQASHKGTSRHKGGPGGELQAHSGMGVLGGESHADAKLHTHTVLTTPRAQVCVHKFVPTLGRWHCSAKATSPSKRTPCA